MRPEYKITELIEKVLMGTANKNEMNEFVVLSEQTGFEASVKYQKCIMEGVNIAGIRQELNFIHSEKYPETAPFFYRKYFLWPLLSIMIGLIVVFLYQNNFNKDKNTILAPIVKKEIVKSEEIAEEPIMTNDSEKDIKTSKEEPLASHTPKLQEKNTSVDQSKNFGALHVNPHHATPSNSKAEVQYFKIFKDFPEKRLVWLSITTLDYDLNYAKFKNRTQNGQIKSLLLPKYENTFVASIPFHKRIEGCLMYSNDGELLNLYLNNTHLKLYQADSLVAEHLLKKAEADCHNYMFYMKAYEFFCYLKSERYGKILKVKELDGRNFRKGGIYKNIPNKKEQEYLVEIGLTEKEADEVLRYFENIYKYVSDFKLARKEQRHLDYYYSNHQEMGIFNKKCKN
ncbi:MAG: hypothetical protein ACK4ND_00935 [Cytophagaceae bacterium]